MYNATEQNSTLIEMINSLAPKTGVHIHRAINHDVCVLDVSKMNDDLIPAFLKMFISDNSLIIEDSQELIAVGRNSHDLEFKLKTRSFAYRILFNSRQMPIVLGLLGFSQFYCEECYSWTDDNFKDDFPYNVLCEHCANSIAENNRDLISEKAWFDRQRLV